MSATVLIREANAADAAGIAHIHYETWQIAYRGVVPDAYLARLSYERRLKAWAEALARPSGSEYVCVAASDAGQIVGFASGGTERTGDPVYRGELNAVYVLPNYHRQGIGRRLVGWVAERLSGAGFGSLLLWTLADSPFRGFYEALGGQFVRESARDFGGVSLGLVAYGWTDIRLLIAAREPGASGTRRP
jgi:GNAT superfamily N-acetyltransferase